MKEQTLEEFINSQPYYGHGTPEYLEGIEVGAKWQAERMYSEQNISLLEWIRNNAVEVQGGWQYDNLTYTDKEIIEFYYKQSKKQDQ